MCLFSERENSVLKQNCSSKALVKCGAEYQKALVADGVKNSSDTKFLIAALDVFEVENKRSLRCKVFIISRLLSTVEHKLHQLVIETENEQCQALVKWEVPIHFDK